MFWGWLAEFWGWLADWSHVLTIVGLGFTLWGTVLAWQAATEDYRKHRGHPVFPQIDRAKSWFLSVVFRRRQDVVVLGSTARAQFSGSGDLTANSYRVVPEDAPLAEQVQYLRDRLVDLSAEVGNVLTSVGEVDKRLSGQISAVHAESHRRAGELTHLIRDVASGGVKQELKGLFLIGIGSVLSAMPGLIS